MKDRASKRWRNYKWLLVSPGPQKMLFLSKINVSFGKILKNKKEEPHETMAERPSNEDTS